MGFMTLGAFREELNFSLGDRAQSGNRLLDAWINRAYFEVVGKMEFEDLKQRETFDTVAGTYEYTLPPAGESQMNRRYLAIISIADLTNKRRLIKTALRNFHLRDRESSGIPKVYARRAQYIMLWPNPDTINSMEVYALLEPDSLLDEDDIAVTPSAWDHAIMTFAKKNAYLSLRMKEDATIEYQAGMNYIGTLLEDMEWEEGTPSEGVNLARDFDDISEMRGG